MYISLASGIVGTRVISRPKATVTIGWSWELLQRNYSALCSTPGGFEIIKKSVAALFEHTMSIRRAELVRQSFEVITTSEPCVPLLKSPDPGTGEFTLSLVPEPRLVCELRIKVYPQGALTRELDEMLQGLDRYRKTLRTSPVLTPKPSLDMERFKRQFETVETGLAQLARDTYKDTALVVIYAVSCSHLLNRTTVSCVLLRDLLTKLRPEMYKNRGQVQGVLEGLCKAGLAEFQTQVGAKQSRSLVELTPAGYARIRVLGVQIPTAPRPQGPAALGD